AKDENLILEELEEKNAHLCEMIPKLRRLIVKIRASPQRKARFSSQCDLYQDVKNLNLILDVKTRWNSTYLMLKRALELQKPLNDITMIKQELKIFLILTEEWNHIKELYRVFEIFHRATEEMSKLQSVTLSSSIPIYNVLLDHLKKLLDSENREYCIIPKVRTAVAKDSIGNNNGNEIANNPAQDQNKSNFFGLFEIGNDSFDEDELEEYLRKPVVHKVTYPHLATMAQDFLAISETSVPVERVFSSEADLLAKKRYNLGKESIQAC
ncbi:7558_t:CDS:2, partial [Funneliformis caledonium]